MTASPQEIFQRYLYLGAMTRNADGVASLFTSDGVIEAPLIPVDHSYPKRLTGREEIRAGLAAFYERTAASEDTDTVDVAKSGYVLHTTTDPDTFIAEIDTVLNGPEGTTTASLVQIFRTRDGQIASLRDYFAPGLVE